MATRPHYQAPGYMPQSMSSGGTYPTSLAQRMMKLVTLRIFDVFWMTSVVESFYMILVLFLSQGYPGRGSQGSGGPRFSGGVHRATELAKKRIADAKTRMKQKSRRLGDRVLSQRVGMGGVKRGNLNGCHDDRHG